MPRIFFEQVFQIFEHKSSFLDIKQWKIFEHEIVTSDSFTNSVEQKPCNLFLVKLSTITGKEDFAANCVFRGAIFDTCQIQFEK